MVDEQGHDAEPDATEFPCELSILQLADPWQFTVTEPDTVALTGMEPLGRSQLVGHPSTAVVVVDEAVLLVDVLSDVVVEVVSEVEVVLETVMLEVVVLDVVVLDVVALVVSVLEVSMLDVSVLDVAMLDVESLEVVSVDVVVVDEVDGVVEVVVVADEVLVWVERVELVEVEVLEVEVDVVRIVVVVVDEVNEVVVDVEEADEVEVSVAVAVAGPFPVGPLSVVLGEKVDVEANVLVSREVIVVMGNVVSTVDVEVVFSRLPTPWAYPDEAAPE